MNAESSNDDNDAEPGGPWVGFRRGLLVMLGLAGAALLFSGPHHWDPRLKIAVANLLAFAFGGLVGATELIARYRDDPARALRTTPARLYMLVNAIVGWTAFWLIFSGRIPAPFEIIRGHPLLNALVIGGFSGMAVFRASVFNVQVRDKTVRIGPAAVLDVMLRAADRAVDRERAAPRAAEVRRIMAGVTFERAHVMLPQYCYTLMQNLGAEERDELDQIVLALKSLTGVSDESKAYNLGLALMNLVGREVLERAVKGLGDRIKGPAPDDPVVLGTAPRLKLPDIAAVRELCVAVTPRSVLDALKPRPLADLLTFDPADMEDSAKVVIALARLRADFGPETVALAIGSHLAAKARPDGQGGAAQAPPGPPPPAGPGAGEGQPPGPPPADGGAPPTAPSQEPETRVIEGPIGVEKFS